MGVEECATGARENLLPQKILLVKSKKKTLLTAVAFY